MGYAWDHYLGLLGGVVTRGDKYDTYRVPPRIGFLTATSRPRKDTIIPGKPFSKDEIAKMNKSKKKGKKKGSKKPPMGGGGY